MRCDVTLFTCVQKHEERRCQISSDCDNNKLFMLACKQKLIGMMKFLFSLMLTDWINTLTHLMNTCVLKNYNWSLRTRNRRELKAYEIQFRTWNRKGYYMPSTRIKTTKTASNRGGMHFDSMAIFLWYLFEKKTPLGSPPWLEMGTFLSIDLPMFY